MRLPQLSERHAVGINMTPMIDVVFQLIIFFLLSSHLLRQEAELPLPLPVAQTGAVREEDSSPRVIVNVHADGRLTIGSRDLSLEQLTAVLAERKQRHGDTFQLRIRSHRDVPYRYLKPVLLAAAENSIWDVQFAVVRQANEE